MTTKEKKEEIVELPAPTPINTKNLKTAWKRSESKLSFREWCRSSSQPWLNQFAKKLCEKYELDQKYMALTTNADRLTNQ